MSATTSGLHESILSPGPPNLLFLPCHGPTGRTHARMNRVKNRHVQNTAAPPSLDCIDTTSSKAAVLPVQIKFKLPRRACRQRSVTTNRSAEQKKVRDSEPSRKTDSKTPCRRPSTICRLPITHSSMCWQPSTWPTSKEDAHSLHYFAEAAVWDVAHYLPGHFWDQVVLQQCQQEPLVLRAVVALSKAHLNRRKSTPVSEQTTAAYSKAIKDLRLYMRDKANPSTTVVVMCCIIFHALNSLLQDAEAAAMHLASGIAILGRQCSSTAGVAEKDTLDDLSVEIVQLDGKAMRTSPNTSDHRLQLGCCNPDRAVPEPMRFHTPHEAASASARIFHCVSRFVLSNTTHRHTHLSKIPEEVSLQHERLEQWLKWLGQATKDYLLSNPAIDVSHSSVFPENSLSKHELIDSIIAIAMELGRIAAKRLLAESLSRDCSDRPWDKKPKKILAMGERLVALQRRLRQKHGVSMHGLLTAPCEAWEPLRLLAGRTKFQEVRRRAEELICELDRLSSTPT